MNHTSTYKSEKPLLPMQRRLFTPHDSEPIDCSKPAELQVIKALQLAEAAVNEAIRHGAEQVTLKYLNILCQEHNPDGMLGRVQVVGYRTEPIPTSDNIII